MTNFIKNRFSKMASQNFSTILLAVVIALMSNFKLIAQNRPLVDVPYEIAPLHAPFEMPELKRVEVPDIEFNIRDYGAQETGKERKIKCTDAIHKAIDAAFQAGGGKVIIPAGEWLTGPIHLLSNLNLHVEEGATVYFSEDKEDYLPVVIQRHEGVEAYNYSPLIYAYKVKNVSVTGKGVFEGQSEHWMKWGVVQSRADATKVPLSRRVNFGKGSGTEGMRPNFLVFWKSEDILIEDITLNDSPMWNIHLVYSKRAIVRGVTVNSLDSHNGDGVVLDSSSDILLEYNTLRTGDDAVVIKSGFNEEGLQINIPTENVIVRNYQAYDVRTGSGGVVFGSETSGGIRNIYVHDAYFEGCDRGIRFKTARGRGNVIENIYVKNIKLKDIKYESININTFYTGSGVGPSPLVRNIEISNIEIDGVANALVLIGLPEKWLEDIKFENIKIVNAREGIRLNRVKNLNMKNIEVESEKRALIAQDVFELYLSNIKLKDKEKGAPFLLKGTDSGVVVMPNYKKGMVEFGPGVNENAIRSELPSAAW